MKRVVADASALGAILFKEPGFKDIVRQLEGAAVCAPDLLRYELANVAVTRGRRHPALAVPLLRAVDDLLRDRSIRWYDVDTLDVAVLAHATRLTAYDATYLWLAGWLGADLVTLDRRLAAAVEPNAVS